VPEGEGLVVIVGLLSMRLQGPATSDPGFHRPGLDVSQLGVWFFAMRAIPQSDPDLSPTPYTVREAASPNELGGLLWSGYDPTE